MRNARFVSLKKSSKILVTGGTGYIGSHVLVDLLQQDYQVVVIDNLSNSSKTSLDRVQSITGKTVTFYQIDVRDEKALMSLFATEGSFQAVMHFAGLKAVGESTKIPLKYYQHNLAGTIALLNVMEQFDCFNFIFSSSATVYGTAAAPYDEESQTGVGIGCPYGRTKYMIEQMLIDMAKTGKWRIMLLRYFNPIGAHPSGLIGEDPQGIPNNLMPYIAQVCVGRRPVLTIYGDDYETKDGTGVRDYIHVVDLAKGHVAALKKVTMTDKAEFCEIYNLGCGVGYSVLQVVKAMEEATGKRIPCQVGPRRQGDLAAFYALSKKAQEELGWCCEKTLADMCRDTWNWQESNPTGYN